MQNSSSHEKNISDWIQQGGNQVNQESVACWCQLTCSSWSSISLSSHEQQQQPQQQWPNWFFLSFKKTHFWPDSLFFFFFLTNPISCQILFHLTRWKQYERVLENPEPVIQRTHSRFQKEKNNNNNNTKKSYCQGISNQNRHSSDKLYKKNKIRQTHKYK